jgi:hypothetical protein
MGDSEALLQAVRYLSRLHPQSLKRPKKKTESLVFVCHN